MTNQTTTKQTNNWNMGKGGKSYNDRMQIHKRRNGLMSNFESPYIAWAVALLCAAVDAVVMWSLLSVIVFNRPIITVVGMLGFLFVYDVGPIYLGNEFRKHKQGLPADKEIIWIELILFAVMTIAHIWLRIVFRTVALPEGDDAISGFYGAATIAMFLWNVIMPICTSGVSFIVSFLTSNPLKQMLKNARESEIELETEINRMESALVEIDSIPDFKDKLIRDDDTRYLAALHQTDNKAIEYCDHVRERIKEHLGEPAALNELSKDNRTALLTRLYADTPDYTDFGNTRPQSV